MATAVHLWFGRGARALLGLSALASVLFGCLASVDHPDAWPCKSDSDCDSGQKCLEGWAECAAKDYCHSDIHCAGDEFCSGVTCKKKQCTSEIGQCGRYRCDTRTTHACKTECYKSSLDCSSGNVCLGDRTCGDPECTETDTSACNGYGCKEGVCRNGCTVGGTGDCAEGFACIGGECAPAECSETDSSDCEGYACDAGVCGDECSENTDCAPGYECNVRTSECYFTGFGLPCTDSSECASALDTQVCDTSGHCAATCDERDCSVDADCAACVGGKSFCGFGQCVNPCVGQECGSVYFIAHGRSVECGSCAQGEECSPDLLCIGPCEEHGYECGTFDGIECGPCPEGSVCEGNLCY